MGREGKRKREGGHDSSSGKRKYFQSVSVCRGCTCEGAATSRLALCQSVSHRNSDVVQNNKAVIPLHSKGFLVSCIGGRERQAAHEAMALFSEVCTVGSSEEHDAENLSKIEEYPTRIEGQLQSLSA